MEQAKAGQQAHWKDVYRRKDIHSVSWFRPHLETSIHLLRSAGLGPGSRVIDVGGGASTLVDDLIENGVQNITVLDLSVEALDVARQRLGTKAEAAHWMVDDLLSSPLPAGGFDIWHDRAVLHFLIEESDANRYAAQVASAVVAGGYAVIAGFAPDGPEQCSGLPVARRSAADIALLLGPSFELIDTQCDQHHTPSGSTQSFVYALLRRV